MDYMQEPPFRALSLKDILKRNHQKKIQVTVAPELVARDAGTGHAPSQASQAS